MRDAAFIKDWIEAVNLSQDGQTPAQPKASGKRGYPSPEPEEMSDVTPTRTKKRKTANAVNEIEDLDHERTPRPLLAHSRTAPSPSPSPTKSSASLRSASLRTSSQASSRASSSRLKLSNLSFVENGVQRQILSGVGTPDLPRPIVDTLKMIQRLERGKQVLSSSLDRTSFKEFLDMNDLDEMAFATNENVGSHLSPDDVDKLQAGAARCFNKDHDEGVWNAEVHQPLLDMVLRRPGSSNLVDFTLCTTAPIIREYLPSHTQEKRVDFCFYIEPNFDSTYKPRIEIFSNSLPEMSVNHTSYRPLRTCPTTVSIETKRPGTDFDGAILQIGVWQSAHWVMLRSLLSRTWKRSSGLSMKEVFSRGWKGIYTNATLAF
ncbi:methyltransferase type 11 [Fusarium austroafricanum]|uniref:Methyltransferase type 11 n=1 Tax=Fusarium austroafricanum TaxID=2364996 RepID=A0A8H4N983_9HYPO|nr:methyltransferase type 11 [Fusarium austroafricanum]